MRIFKKSGLWDMVVIVAMMQVLKNTGGFYAECWKAGGRGPSIGGHAERSSNEVYKEDSPGDR